MCKVKIKRKEFEAALARNNMSLRSLARALGEEGRVSYLSACKTGAAYPGAVLRRKLQRELKVNFEEIFSCVDKVKAP